MISFRLLRFVGEADTHGVSRAGTLWDGLSWQDSHKKETREQRLSFLY